MSADTAKIFSVKTQCGVANGFLLSEMSTSRNRSAARAIPSQRHPDRLGRGVHLCVAGGRRWRTRQAAGFLDIPGLVLNVLRLLGAGLIMRNYYVDARRPGLCRPGVRKGRSILEPGVIVGATGSSISPGYLHSRCQNSAVSPKMIRHRAKSLT